MVKIIIICLVIMVIVGWILFYKAIKEAHMVDPKEPFLTGDYDPKKDPTLQMSSEK